MTTLETVRVSLPSGGELCGGLALAGADAVVYVHGFGSHRGGEKALAVAASCARHGLGFAAFDFRCHGESSGAMPELRGSGLLDDLDAVRDFLAGRGVGRLFPVGSSMGGWAGAWFARRRPDAVPALALIAPGFRFLHAGWERLDDAAQRQWQADGTMRFRNQWLDVELGHGLVAERDRFDPAELAAGWRTPALIFHGMRDDVVPWQDTLRLVEATPFPHVELRLFRDGDHRLTAFKDEMAEEACRFFARWR